jgi:hypothetical protein
VERIEIYANSILEKEGLKFRGIDDTTPEVLKALKLLEMNH